MFLAYKKQWVGIQGAPVVSNFSFQAPTPKRLAIGLNFNQDSRGVLNTSSFSFATAYNIPINKEVFFRFGLSAGASWNRTNIDALRFGAQANDQVISGLLQNQMQVIGSSGLSIHSKTFHLGLALPHLFQPVYLTSDPFNVAPFKPLDQVIVHGSYRMYLSNDQIVFEPFLNYRFNRIIPSQLEVAGVVHLKGLVWGGLSYKQDFGISGMAGFKLSPGFAFGYAYSIKNTGLNELGRPSHEVQIGYLFGRQHKNAPVYSFVNTAKKKLRSRQQMMLAQRSKKPALVTAAKKGSPVVKATGGGTIPKAAPTTARTTPAATNTRPPVVAQNQPRTTPDQTGQPAPNQAAVQNNPAPGRTTPPAVQERRAVTQPRLADQTSGAPPSEEDEEEGEDAAGLHGVSHLDDSLQRVDESERLTRLDIHKNNPLEEHVGDAKHADRYEQIKIGQHQSEMDLGEYVVVGVFKTEDTAKKYTDGLKSLGFNDLDYGFLSEKNTWFVHSVGTNDPAAAQATRERYRKLKVFRDAWLLTVQP